jgi:hypothetical protein
MRFVVRYVKLQGSANLMMLVNAHLEDGYMLKKDSWFESYDPDWDQ